MVWYRPRAARVFGFEYRFEIFVPDAMRRWGVYVLPFLHGDRLVARVDVKAERDRSRLAVRAVIAEPGCGSDRVVVALAEELRSLAAWLGLETVSVTRRGPFARALRAALRRP